MAKIRKFKCSKCNTRFSMAAHLGRHMNAAHASKMKRKLGRKKLAKHAQRRVVGPAARAAAVRRPALGLAGVMRRMQACHETLAAQRTELDSQIGAIDQALSALGATWPTAETQGARAHRGAAPRKGSLKDFVATVLRAGGGPMGVKDVTSVVLRAGYELKNKALAHSVGVALSEMAKVTRVARGQYRLRQ